jgi:hypothetical protein
MYRTEDYLLVHAATNETRIVGEPLPAEGTTKQMVEAVYDRMEGHMLPIRTHENRGEGVFGVRLVNNLGDVYFKWDLDDSTFHSPFKHRLELQQRERDGLPLDPA